MPEVKGFLSHYDSIGALERRYAAQAAEYPLSGFLGGKARGGKWVRELEDSWADRFGVKHAVATNSATSGLLAAAFAVGLGRGDSFIVSPYTMSATAAAPMFTGAEPVFVDVEDQTFCLPALSDSRWPGSLHPKAVFTTSLFGHPSHAMNTMPELGRSQFLIEDNSQAPFAMEGKCYAGTFGDIGVFSLNVHKHLQCGEGGICVTDSDELADNMRRTINHGEMAGGAIGLNLRLTEVSAAIALAQLSRADEIMFNRIEQAHMLLEAIGDIPGIRGPVCRIDCHHVYYAIPFLIENCRSEFVNRMEVEGVPLGVRYVNPLYRLPAFAKYARKCPVAEDLHDRRLFLFENCAWSPTREQIKQIGSAFRKVAEEMKL